MLPEDAALAGPVLWMVAPAPVSVFVTAIVPRRAWTWSTVSHATADQARDGSASLTPPNDSSIWSKPTIILSTAGTSLLNGVPFAVIVIRGGAICEGCRL